MVIIMMDDAAETCSARADIRHRRTTNPTPGDPLAQYGADVSRGARRVPVVDDADRLLSMCGHHPRRKGRDGSR
ncbi:hypothetical protein [Nocardia sputorum]|uniref:hypothetical protein n=1 Tax=Nocardia sputorum TaxID=2984338 RepID=UPI002492FF91|nr:hypothetical protein [Nocardia sputorum]